MRAHFPPSPAWVAGKIDAVLIDITRLIFRRAAEKLPTGIDRVGLAYAEQHAAAARAVLVYRSHSVVLRAADSRAAFEWLLSSETGVRAASWARLAGWIARAQWQHAASAGELLLNTGHRGLEHSDYAADLRACGVRPMFLIHDLIPITHPEYCRQGEDERHLQRMNHALALGSGLIVNSRSTLEALRAHANRGHLPMPPTVVAPLAPGFTLGSTAPRPLDAKYFVVLGTIEPRKNHLLLLNLWRILVQRLGAAAPHLVVIGRRGWECEETLNLLDRCPDLRDHVHELGQCGDLELAAWLQHAQALLFPSFCEGYGMPAIEALASGVPVIASDLPVFRESVAEVPEYASPVDGQRWLDLIIDYAQANSARRLAQLQRLAQFKAPGWDEHHRLVAALIGQLGSGVSAQATSVNGTSYTPA